MGGSDSGIRYPESTTLTRFGSRQWKTMRWKMDLKKVLLTKWSQGFSLLVVNCSVCLSWLSLLLAFHDDVFGLQFVFTKINTSRLIFEYYQYYVCCPFNNYCHTTITILKTTMFLWLYNIYYAEWLLSLLLLLLRQLWIVTIQPVAAKGTSPEGHSAATSSCWVFDQSKSNTRIHNAINTGRNDSKWRNIVACAEVGIFISAQILSNTCTFLCFPKWSK